jgi:hypothetical protein
MNSFIFGTIHEWLLLVFCYQDDLITNDERGVCTFGTRRRDKYLQNFGRRT